MTVTFGFDPYAIEVLLARGSRFSAAITTEDPWPEDVAIELRFTDHTEPDAPRHLWPAEVTRDQATWDIPADDVDAVIADRTRLAVLMFRTAGQPIVWGKGPARVIV